jgi:regulator of protease activity HflC (stomatin/prohibitin superfamily)
VIDSDDRRASGPDGPDGVAEAMNRVLDAERAALAEIEACRVEADKSLEAARHEARTILERAERIARNIHARTERLAATRARHMVEAARDDADNSSRENPLESAVRRLAVRMTGGSDA